MIVTESTQAGASPPHLAMTALASVADEIAARLGETEEEPIRQIRRAVRLLGADRVQSVAARALQVEAAGGMMRADGSQKRSLGGVWDGRTFTGSSRADNNGDLVEQARPRTRRRRQRRSTGQRLARARQRR